MPLFCVLVKIDNWMVRTITEILTNLQGIISVILTEQTTRERVLIKKIHFYFLGQLVGKVYIIGKIIFLKVEYVFV